MATSNKVFVSPGVYTTESELSYVAQSVGVTTLGVVGETLKGPAFEPIFVTNYDEFQAYFGTTSPEKFVNTQIPKYELAYIAKSYLQQSNQLFVTRVLGLSGYDAGPSWSIKTIANVNPSTIGLSGGTGQPTTFSFTYTASSATTVVTYDTFGASVTTWTGTPMYSDFSTPYTKFNGSSSSYQANINALVLAVANNSALSATTAGVWGPITGNVASDIIANRSGYTNEFGIDSVQLTAFTASDSNNDVWYYSSFDISSGESYTGYSWAGFVSAFNSSTGVGTFSGTWYTWTGQTYSGYNEIVVSTLRSRGISEYDSDSDGMTYQVTGLSDVSLVTSGAYSAVTQNPFSTFVLSGTQYNGRVFSFEVSMDDTDANFVSKVLGSDNFSKNRVDVPIFAEEKYPTWLYYAYNKGYVRGLSGTLIANPRAKDLSGASIANYLERYQTAYSPWVVSELRGNTVFKLFRYITISDGNSSNREVKVSLANMTFDNNTFDVLVRDFYDTDANPVVLEKYTNCSMDQSQNNYIGVKVGSADGEYAINSKYIMLDLNPDAPADALPCGFEGYLVRTYNNSLTPVRPEIYPIYKTKYYYPGETIFNPPFGTSSGSDDATISNGENIRRAYLGFSNTVGWDNDFFDYKGKQTPTGWTCTEQTYSNWSKLTKGFHMDSGATVVLIDSAYSTSGTPAFEVGSTSFRNDPTDPNNAYYRTYSRKFTVLAYGGFDGWDIYRENRTNNDDYQLGKARYLYGAKEGCQPYPNATGWGAFRQITVEDNTSDFGNTDFYAYKLGILTFQNPAIININVLATPGIDSTNNYQLVKAAIDMVEIDRADSIYVMTSPDFDLYQPSTSMDNFIYPQDAVDDLANQDIDSNYTVTYYPWVLTRDSVANTQIYIPATAEVCRNLALTDNISFPWFATAGYTRGIVNSVRARRRLTQLDRDTLYQGRINPIATFNDVGTVIWGNKTLQLRESPLDRINVRRLLLQARKLISAVAIRLLFEQNDAVVRQQFLDSVNPILDAIRRDRGITDFRVTVSSTPEELDSNQMSGRIFLKPTKALEYIDLEFVITPQGASFENI
jgi:hypothetical protein